MVNIIKNKYFQVQNNNYSFSSFLIVKKNKKKFLRIEKNYPYF